MPTRSVALNSLAVLDSVAQTLPSEADESPASENHHGCDLSLLLAARHVSPNRFCGCVHSGTSTELRRLARHHVGWRREVRVTRGMVPSRQRSRATVLRGAPPRSWRHGKIWGVHAGKSKFRRYGTGRPVPAAETYCASISRQSWEAKSRRPAAGLHLRDGGACRRQLSGSRRQRRAVVNEFLQFSLVSSR